MESRRYRMEDGGAGTALLPYGMISALLEMDV